MPTAGMGQRQGHARRWPIDHLNWSAPRESQQSCRLSHRVSNLESLLLRGQSVQLTCAAMHSLGDGGEPKNQN